MASGDYREGVIVDASSEFLEAESQQTKGLTHSDAL